LAKVINPNPKKVLVQMLNAKKCLISNQKTSNIKRKTELNLVDNQKENQHT
jgi:hypothetical protein